MRQKDGERGERLAEGGGERGQVRRQPSIDANETLDASFQDLVTGMTGGYEPVPMLVRGPSRQLGRKRVPANAIFTVTGTGARLNGDRLLIFGASPAVSFVTTAPVYRAGTPFYRLGDRPLFIRGTAFCAWGAPSSSRV